MNPGGCGVPWDGTGPRKTLLRPRFFWRRRKRPIFRQRFCGSTGEPPSTEAPERSPSAIKLASAPAPVASALQSTHVVAVHVLAQRDHFAILDFDEERVAIVVALAVLELPQALG